MLGVSKQAAQRKYGTKTRPEFRACALEPAFWGVRDLSAGEPATHLANAAVVRVPSSTTSMSPMARRSA